MTRVHCPVCSLEVAEADINLHLDLQCRGPAGPSCSTTTSRSSGAHSVPPSEEPKSTPIDLEGTSQRLPSQVHVVDDDTPPRSTRPLKIVASIFNGKRKASADDVIPDTTSRGGSQKRAAADAGRTEKKPKANALIAAQPLAERSRPSTLDGYFGQADIVGPGSLLRARIEAGEGVGSCILWGPPGCGKTTLARLIARTANADFKELSATRRVSVSRNLQGRIESVADVASSGAADVRQVFEQARNGLRLTGRKTILMVDEIHRFNKSQQDLFLPYVENGWVQLIGATTENPSFKVNGALLSRCQVFTLSKHEAPTLERILQSALAMLPHPTPRLPPDLLPFLADVADGDARQALNSLELALNVCTAPTQKIVSGSDAPRMQEEELAKRDEELMEAIRKGLRKGYDRSGEERYDMISALHKCLRGSDGSAAMYWLARMITGGEDALYIARRLVVVASEDVGLADSQALPVAMATYQACQVIGLPECRINLAHCVAYLAEAPKSTRAYTAYGRAEALAIRAPLPGVPLQIRNAPTKLLKQLGYGEEYSYNPAFAHPVHNAYLPTGLLEHSSFAADDDKHILKTPEAELKGKTWDQGRLREWEDKVNGGSVWDRPLEPELQ